jgi:hypothetical protein
MNFKFPVEVNAALGAYGFLSRFCARRVATMLAEAQFQTFDAEGHSIQGMSYVKAHIDKYQVIHWILQAAGYYCTLDQVKERCGIQQTINPEEIKKRGLVNWIAHAKVPWLKL